MIEIPVVVTGEHWTNPEQVQQMLENCDASENLILDLRAEGPCLGRVGIIDTIQQHCLKTGRSPDSIWIKSWSNNVESIPFKRADQHLLSHCFWMSEQYAIPIQDIKFDAKLFGFFVGRRTLSRMKIMKDLWDTIPEQCFFSLMKSRTGITWRSAGHNLEQGWVDAAHMEEFEAWAQDPPITSVDDHWIHEHFLPEHNTNRDLLGHYSNFKIEIVAETYSLGECFFPTEKTVRPIVGGKPMVIYGPKNFLERLKKLGFRTWSDHWDESYDQLEGPERWYAMFDVIKNINDVPDKKIAEHNLKMLNQLVEKHRPG